MVIDIERHIDVPGDQIFYHTEYGIQLIIFRSDDIVPLALKLLLPEFARINVYEHRFSA